MAADETWIMADGTRVAVADMTEAHAKNALRMLLRRRRENPAGLLVQMIRLALAQEELREAEQRRIVEDAILQEWMASEYQYGKDS